jgi:hypothetical protein
MRDDNLFKAASGLSGGVGLMGDVCGSLLGASLMLGSVYGRERDEIGNFEKLKNSAVPVGKLYKWFEKEFGSATCRDIRTRFGGGAYYDFGVPWQRELANEAGIFKKCSDLCGKTAARTAEMLWDALEAEKKKQKKKK